MKFFCSFSERFLCLSQKQHIQLIVLQNQIFYNPPTFVIPCSIFDIFLLILFFYYSASIPPPIQVEDNHGRLNSGGQAARATSIVHCDGEFPHRINVTRSADPSWSAFIHTIPMTLYQSIAIGQ